MSDPRNFDEFFTRATGVHPYKYQRRLASPGAPPSVVEVPTGSGKTAALLVSWLYSRLREEKGPRRLVYALPMRALVEQTRDAAREIRRRLGLSDDEIPIHVLMGGESPTDWRERPEQNQILIGTIDMLLSRALNRGYAESRFSWPVSFGLLNADCRWVFDEVQLMGPARGTSAQLDGLRTSLGTALPCETIWVSATVDRAALQTVDRPELGAVISLSDEDRGGPLLRRLNARKVLERVEIGEWKGRATAREIAETLLNRHVSGTRTLVVLNTVERAQALFARLQPLAARDGNSPKAVLLHSRFRPPEREAQMKAALSEPGSPGTIVVATQVVEAGVDVSARTLVTEPAPFSSIVQRLGRCNRAGEYGGDQGATVLWLDSGALTDDAAGRKAAAPYRPGDIENARAALLDLEGSSLSPSALEGIDIAESADDPAVLRRRDLLDLFDTSPDLSGMDIDVAPFIREDDDRSVTVFFRDLGDQPGPRLDDEALPSRDEVVQVPRGSLEGRNCWVPDHVQGGWARARGREVPPGGTAMLNASDGGYLPATGWDPKSETTVDTLPPEDKSGFQGLSADPLSATSEPRRLLDHLQDVADEGARLASSLGLGEWEEVLRSAGALHDLGKAHPVFQAMLRSVIDLDDHPSRDRDLWAKSGRHGGRRERPYFRHELASALAVLTLNGEVDLPRRELTTYLIAAHHGKVRLSIRPAPGEERPEAVSNRARFALGIADGDVLPEVETPIGQLPEIALDLSPMELGAERSWTDAAVRLRDDPELGPFRLGLLESLLRVADWKASRG